MRESVAVSTVIVGSDGYIFREIVYKPRDHPRG
jgi:hypothetical protein